MIFDNLVTKFWEINSFGPWYYPTQGPLCRRNAMGGVLVLPVLCHLIPVPPWQLGSSWVAMLSSSCGHVAAQGLVALSGVDCMQLALNGMMIF